MHRFPLAHLKIGGLVLLVCFLNTNLFSQSNQTTRDQMEKLDFMIGEWEGEGWIQMGAGNRSHFKGLENVQKKVGGKALLVEGIHKALNPDQSVGRIVHEALGVISWDQKAQKYRFQSNLTTGQYTMAEGNIIDGAFVWGFRQGDMDMRFTIKLNEQGEWSEKGETSQDGKSWSQFFQMTMHRKK